MFAQFNVPDLLCTIRCEKFIVNDLVRTTERAHFNKIKTSGCDIMDGCQVSDPRYHRSTTFFVAKYRFFFKHRSILNWPEEN